MLDKPTCASEEQCEDVMEESLITTLLILCARSQNTTSTTGEVAPSTLTARRSLPAVVFLGYRCLPSFALFYY